MSPPALTSTNYSRWIVILGVEALVLVAVVFGVAWAIDEVGEAWRGTPPWAVCGVASWLPWKAIPQVAVGIAITGAMTLFVPAYRIVGIALLALAALGYFMPDVFTPAWLSDRCPWIGVD